MRKRRKMGFFLLSFSLFLCVSAGSLSCSSAKPTDMRALVPADALVYLETNDLAAALQPIIDSKPFTEAAKYKPDISALKGLQIAVAVTGFKTSDEKVDKELFIGRIQPNFVAIADTHAWNFQAVGFAEKKLGSFVTKIYDSEPSLEITDKNGGKYFIWTANDGRKAHALVIDSLIYFSNDETAIDKCLSVRHGETDSILKTGKIQPADPQTLASGYVSTDGVAQIANIVGLQLASESSQESEVQSVITDIVPQLLRNSITEISWRATRSQFGIEDEYTVRLKPDVAKVFNETLAMPASNSAFQETDFEDFIPTEAASITRYVLRDPLMSWRSVLFTFSGLVEPKYAPMLGVMSGSVLDNYEIEDPELFFGSVIDRRILTARIDQNGDEAVVITKVKDIEQFKRSLSKDIDFSKPGESAGEALLWRSADSEITIAVLKTKVLRDDTDYADLVIIGDSGGVEKCLQAKSTGNDFTKRERYKQFEITTATALTISNEIDPEGKLIGVLSEKKERNQVLRQRTFTSTWYDEIGMYRHTMSDFGLIGSIIAWLDDE